MTARDYVGGLMTVRIQGLNLTRLLNGIVKDYGTVRDITRISHSEMILTMEKKSCLKLLSQIDKVCYNIEVIQERGLRYRLERILSRAGLLAGLVICIALVAVFNSFVWIVDIDSPSENVSEAVLEILKNNNIKSGSAISYIDTEKLKLEIETSIEEVSSVNVVISGVELKISVKEITPKLPVIVEGDGYDILARYDCRIETIAVISGTPLVKKGSIVKAGTVLVKGVKLDETGEKPVEVPIKAQAEIYGTVWFSSSKIFTPTRIETERTGNVIKERSIELLRLSLKSKPPLIEFSEYETDRQTRYATRNNLLPLKYTTVYYYETVKTEKLLDIDVERPNLQSEALKEALAKVYEDCLINRTYFYEQSYEGITRIEATVETRANVGIRA